MPRQGENGTVESEYDGRSRYIRYKKLVAHSPFELLRLFSYALFVGELMGEQKVFEIFSI
jgi:hypothetical protein